MRTIVDSRRDCRRHGRASDHIVFDDRKTVCMPSNAQVLIYVNHFVAKHSLSDAALSFPISTAFRQRTPTHMCCYVWSQWMCVRCVKQTAIFVTLVVGQSAYLCAVQAHILRGDSTTFANRNRVRTQSAHSIRAPRGHANDKCVSAKL